MFNFCFAETLMADPLPPLNDTVHPDFKSHMGGTMSFKVGKGSAIDVSAKQKLNTESFMAAKPVGVDCVPPLALWVPLFLKEQGHNVKEKVIKQDNESAILLANGGKASSGEQT